LSEPRVVRVRELELGNALPFVLIAGPCQIESEAHAFEMADALRAMAQAAGVGLIYKSSYDKANRTSASAARGVGMARGLEILAAVRERYLVPVLTDVHGPEQCDPAAEAVDVLQIPAFLCRQTDLLIAAGETGRTINVKKGQFLAPWDMENVAAKIAGTGNESILLTERGASFGYNTLVSDFRALPINPPGPRRSAQRRAEHDPLARDGGAGGAAEGLGRLDEGYLGRRGAIRPVPSCIE
jgi:2-dehydro-3-deoxyphosphooctonate aldolase (KDO 8-P synthase)